MLGAYYSRWQSDTCLLSDVVVKAWQGSSITVDNVASWYFTKTRHVNKITWPGHYIGLGVRPGTYRVPNIIVGKVTRVHYQT